MCSELSYYVWSVLPPATSSVPVLCECPCAYSQGRGEFQPAFKAPLASSSQQLLPEKHGRGAKHDLEMQWAGGSVLPTHSQRWCPLESSSPSSQDSVSSNSVRKAYSLSEGGLFRDPCYGCSHSLSSFPCESGIPFFLQHEGREEPVAQCTCTPRQPSAGRGR